MSDLDHALRQLSRDRASPKWDARTAGGAPHKPLVLLALCDVAEGNLLERPFAPFEGAAFEALARSFQTYWKALFPGAPAGALWMPLWYLQSDGFWTPIARDGARSSSRPSGMTSLREQCSGARLDAELFKRLHDPLEREDLRALLLGAYFDDETRVLLLERMRWNRAAEHYARELLDPQTGERVAELSERARLVAESAADPEPVRSQGFRIAVLSAYEHRCAACGLRLQTPEGLSAVQAAHIVPWSLTHDDRIANGLALCPTCHWTFDHFLWTTRPPRSIATSRNLRFDRNVPAHLETLHGRELLAPAIEAHGPDPASLDWHRRQNVA